MHATRTSLEVPPCSMVDFSQAELLGRWIRLLYSLRDDLSPLEDHTRMTMEDWVKFFDLPCSRIIFNPILMIKIG